MRLATLILVSGILLSCPSLLLALNQEAKTKILIDEWKEAVKPPASITDESNVLNHERPKEKDICLSLPEVFQKKMTLRSSGVNLKTLLNKIGQVTGFNIVYDPEVDSNINVSVDCQDVPVWRALNTILFPLAYGFKIKDNDLVILSKETRTFKLNLPPSTQGFSDTVSNESWTNPGGIGSNNTGTLSGTNSNMSGKVGARVFVESKEDDISFWKDIERNLSKMISERGKYSFNKLAGLVMVSDNPIVLDKIGRYIDLVNAESNKQILIEVKVLEVTLSKQNAFGIDWNAIYKNLAGIKKITLNSNFASQNIATGSLFTLDATTPKDDSGTGSSGTSALIQALETQGKVEVISQPKVMLLNNQSAMVQVGTVTSYVANTTTTAPAMTSAPTNSLRSMRCQYIAHRIASAGMASSR